ncbi:hypothetical protein V8F33_004511 [Rhypophila sp. PSN 637]
MPRNPNSIWQQNKSLFRRLYLEDDNPLKVVKLIAERDHNFPPTPLSTYETKLRDELKLRKNLKPEEWAAIGRDLKSRCGQCGVLLCGVRVSDDKVKRNIRRYRKAAVRVLPATPPGMGSSSHPSTRKPNISGTGPRSLASTELGKHTSVLVNQVYSLIGSPHNSVDFIQFSAPILDRRFVDQWSPLLDKLPLIEFQVRFRSDGMSSQEHSIQHFQPNHKSTAIFSISHRLVSTTHWGPDSVVSLEELELMDAFEIGFLATPPCSSFTDSLEPPPLVAPHYPCQLSIFRDPFYALVIVLHHLSNQNITVPMWNLIHELFHQIPTSVLELIFCIDCPTIRAAWTDLLNVACYYDNRSLFNLLARTMLQNKVILLNSPRMLSKLLCHASWFGVTDVCRDLVDLGASPNEEHQFLTRGSLPFKVIFLTSHHDSLSAASVRGNVEIVKLLLENGVNVNAGDREPHLVAQVLRRLGGTNEDRDRRLHVLSLLLAAGADVHTPVPYQRKHHMSSMPVSGIILAAMEGTEAFSHYFVGISRPVSEDAALSMGSAALSECIIDEKIAAVSVMIQAGLRLDSGREYACAQALFDIFENFPLSPALVEIASCIRWDYHWTIYWHGLVRACIANPRLEMWRFLLDHLIGAECTDQFGLVVIMAMAIRLHNLAVVGFLRQPPFNLSLDTQVHFGDHRFSALFLSAGSSCKDFPLAWLSSGAPPSSSSHWVEGEQLMCLLQNGLLSHGSASIYEFLLPQIQSVEQFWLGYSETYKDIIDWLHDRAVPVFSGPEAFALRPGQGIETAQHPLSYFISIQASPPTRLRRWNCSWVSRILRYKGATRVEVLLKAGANPSGKGKFCCFTPLQLTMDAEVVKLLLAYGADPNENVSRCEQCAVGDKFKDRWLPNQDKSRSLLSYKLARRGRDGDLSKAFIQQLLEGGSKLVGDELALACSTGNVEIVKLLLDWNANVNPSGPAAYPALSAAAKEANLSMVLLLLAAGAMVEPEVDDVANSPLAAAAKRGALDVVFLLMQLETRDHVIAQAMVGALAGNHLCLSN